MPRQQGHRAAKRLDRLFPADPCECCFAPEELIDLLAKIGLANREREVACLLIEGHSNSEIAARLDIARSTLRTHLNRLFTKLRVQTPVGLVLRLVAIKLSLTEAGKCPSIEEEK